MRAVRLLRGKGLGVAAALLGAGCLAAAGCALVAPLDGLAGGSAGDAGAGDSSSAGDDSTGGHEAGPDATQDSPGGPDGSTEASPADAPSEGAAPEAGSDATADAQADGPVDAPAEGPTDGPPDSPSSLYRAAVLADTPLAYWRLGETSGTIAHDETGNGRDGTYVGGVTLGQPGALTGDANTAVTLDGTTGEIDVGNVFDFAGATPFSFEAWVKATLLDTTYRHVMTKMMFDNGGNPMDGEYILLYSGTNDLGFERWNASTAELALETDAFPGTGQWVYLVVTYDGSIGTIYVNGASKIAESALGNPAANSVHMLWGNLVQGQLDELAVYGAPLSQARITAHYAAAQ